ncbi:peptide-N-glycosidase F-like protein [Pontibacter ummariensis]|uniref:Peptide-N-glycosidase F, C terminal n=1 Tax=Pontibacter ummariensis TaxID=1610492 RepID=A0A239L4P7_9BACT|nr:peptide-N-glycosidase F-related protein [Pontibacter ummariensis]PRY04316.1 peptide-N-glycosidase F-like protein [Pontibacter ummariensis]SNT24888.1 Peptide-N-glycosidase F, C terminal [Pontibacter ummariensis]
MKYRLTTKVWRYSLIALLSLITLQTHASDTLHVVTHNRMTVVTDPSQGNNHYKAWGVFPYKGQNIRSIKLKLRLGCPDDMRCADWDYKDHITIRRTGGKEGESQDIEIGRMLTPYGGAFGKDWTFDWEVDITDFSLLLRDSVEIEYNHTGWEPNEDRGWTVTLDFEIVKGKPAWEPISIQKVYDGAYRYGDPANPIENALRPVIFTADENAAFARLRVVQTGHGMDKPDNCAEFCSKYRAVYFDQKLIDRRDIWKKCGENPLYPQAGTWVYARANWCPGDLMQPDLYDLPVKPRSQHTVDINMEDYTSTEPSADEYITAYIIQYRKPAAKNDVAITDIIRPSLKDAHRRQNPANMQPHIVVKNMGALPVTSLAISYGTKGFEQREYNWTGKIAPAATAMITLSGVIDSKVGQNRFEVKLQRPNGKKDKYTADNSLASTFEAVPRQDGMLIVYLMTNNEPTHNSYKLKDSEGNTIRERVAGSLKANTVYRDTVQLAVGNYDFTLQDSAGNGLEFWANPRGGRGKLRLLNKDGAILKDFESDFGSSVSYAFEVGAPVAPVTDQSSFGLYPTRTNDTTTFDYYANFPHNVEVQIETDPGNKVVEKQKYEQIKEGVFTYDLSRYPKGRFYLKVFVDGEEKFKKRIRLKE